MTRFISWLKSIFAFLKPRSADEGALDRIFSELERESTILVMEQIAEFRKRRAPDGR